MGIKMNLYNAEFQVKQFIFIYGQTLTWNIQYNFELVCYLIFQFLIHYIIPENINYNGRSKKESLTYSTKSCVLGNKDSVLLRLTLAVLLNSFFIRLVNILILHRV